MLVNKVVEDAGGAVAMPVSTYASMYYSAMFVYDVHVVS